eukprot:COSAG01_NODE_27889_length_674_cov_1.139130_1_plen_52_part_10
MIVNFLAMIVLACMALSNARSQARHGSFLLARVSLFAMLAMHSVHAQVLASG